MPACQACPGGCTCPLSSQACMQALLAALEAPSRAWTVHLADLGQALGALAADVTMCAGKLAYGLAGTQAQREHLLASFRAKVRAQPGDMGQLLLAVHPQSASPRLLAPGPRSCRQRAEAGTCAGQEGRLAGRRRVERGRLPGQLGEDGSLARRPCAAERRRCGGRSCPGRLRLRPCAARVPGGAMATHGLLVGSAAGSLCAAAQASVPAAR